LIATRQYDGLQTSLSQSPRTPIYRLPPTHYSFDQRSKENMVVA
jgi:hypothetical protein